MAVLAGLHWQLTPFYSNIGQPSIDPELMKGALPCRPVSIKPRNNLGVAFPILVGPSLQRAASSMAFTWRFMIS
jgi:hypothetical protein